MKKLTEREKKIVSVCVKLAIHELNWALYKKKKIKHLTELFNDDIEQKVLKFIEELKID